MLESANRQESSTKQGTKDRRGNTMDTVGHLRIFIRVPYYDSYKDRNYCKTVTLCTENLPYQKAKERIDQFKADNPEMRIESTFTIWQ